MIKKRLAQNFGANLFAQFTNVLLQLATVPLFLTFWSKDRYGVWLLISAIPAYLSLSEAGFATLAQNQVGMAITQGDRKRALGTLHTAWGYLVGISIAVVLLSCAALFAIPWNAWFNYPSVSGAEVKWTIFFLSLCSVGCILSGIFGAIYRAAYRNARYQFMCSGNRLVELAAVAVGVILTRSMIAIALLMLAARAVAFLWLYWDSRRFSPDLVLGFSGFTVPELKRSWWPSVMFMASNLGNAVYFQGLTLLVGASLGAGAVVVYSTTRTLTRVIAQFAVMLKQSSLPEFSYLFAAGDMQRVRRLNEFSFEVSVAACVALAAMIFFAAPLIMPVWTHHVVQVEPYLLAIFLASAILNGLWTANSSLLMGTNNHEAFTIRYLLAACFAIILAKVLVQPYGLYGVGWAMLGCELVLLPYVISKSCYLVRQPVKEFVCSAMQLRAVREAAAGYYQRWLAKAQ